MAVDEIVGVPGLLCSIAEELRQADPDEHIVQFNPQTWLTQFPEDGDIASLLELHPGEISRRDVLDVAPVRASDNSRTRQFAMAVMIWGYGTVGYGAHRTSLMLAARSAVEKLSAGASYVAKGDLANACLYFRNAGALPQFGWSFFTKYFYFVAAAHILSLLLHQRRIDSSASASPESASCFIPPATPDVLSTPSRISAIGFVPAAAATK
jgi:hypothetical protein